MALEILVDSVSRCCLGQGNQQQPGGDRPPTPGGSHSVASSSVHQFDEPAVVRYNRDKQQQAQAQLQQQQQRVARATSSFPAPSGPSPSRRSKIQHRRERAARASASASPAPSASASASTAPSPDRFSSGGSSSSGGRPSQASARQASTGSNSSSSSRRRRRSGDSSSIFRWQQQQQQEEERERRRQSEEDAAANAARSMCGGGGGGGGAGGAGMGGWARAPPALGDPAYGPESRDPYAPSFRCVTPSEGPAAAAAGCNPLATVGSRALCFATPVYAASTADPDAPPEDERTLNTCEGGEDAPTVGSATLFEAKFADIVETSPPMPLYREDEVRALSAFHMEEIAVLAPHRASTPVANVGVPSGGAGVPSVARRRQSRGSAPRAAAGGGAAEVQVRPRRRRAGGRASPVVGAVGNALRGAGNMVVQVGQEGARRSMSALAVMAASSTAANSPVPAPEEAGAVPAVGGRQLYPPAPPVAFTPPSRQPKGPAMSDGSGNSSSVPGMEMSGGSTSSGTSGRRSPANVSPVPFRLLS